MAQGSVHEGRISHRGFASMNTERQRQIASMGGKAVPDEKRSFSQNRRLAAEAGRKGGQSVPRLAGQREDYLLKALRGYKDNSRRGYDAAMSDVVYALKDADFVELAYFLARSK